MLILQNGQEVESDADGWVFNKDNPLYFCIGTSNQLGIN